VGNVFRKKKKKKNVRKRDIDKQGKKARDPEGTGPLIPDAKAKKKPSEECRKQDQTVLAQVKATAEV